MDAPIVIYQMDNVGSSGVFTMLSEAESVNRPLYQLHTLRDDGIGRNIIDHADWEEKRHIVDSVAVRRLLASSDLSGEVSAEKKWKWITLVREPIARNLSAFFQDHQKYIPDMIGRWEGGDLTVSEIRDTFIQLYDHAIPLRWFDDEYKALFQLNVFEVPFDQKEGYLVMQTNVFDIMLLRSEDLDTFQTELFEEFIGVKGLVLKPFLVGGDLPYAEVYKTFKAEVRFPERFVKTMLESPYVKLFYSEDQIEGFMRKYVE